MISKAEIMKAAWAAFRKTPSWWQVGDLRAKTFANALRQAWARAKFAHECAIKDAEIAARKAAELRNYVLKAPEVYAIQRAIDDLKYKSFRYDIAAERRVLEGKLAALVAA